jgi:hypothetical protein
MRIKELDGSLEKVLNVNSIDTDRQRGVAEARPTT